MLDTSIYIAFKLFIMKLHEYSRLWFAVSKLPKYIHSRPLFQYQIVSRQPSDYYMSKSY